MIAAIDLRKSYGNLVAVDGVSFEVAPGECFGLLGPNGAGKTTTIHLLTGLLRPDAGRVVVDGHDDPTRPAVRARLGTIPQALALYDELTGERNLRFFGRMFGLCGRRLSERVEWALDLTGLAERRADLVAEYSGGMKRRLNIACSLLHDPPVLLFDEPTVGVDPQSRNLIFDTLERLKGEGRTVLYTTHYMEEAQRLCDRVAIMDGGRLLALDTVAALIAAHGGASVVEADFARVPETLAAAHADDIAGHRLRATTDTPMDLVRALAAAGPDVLTLAIQRPTLEDVFLNLTGRSLRDA